MNHAREVIRCEAAYRMGLTGRGIGVAVLDTGIYLHEDFEHRVAAFTDMVHRRREHMMTTVMERIFQESLAEAEILPMEGIRG